MESFAAVCTLCKIPTDRIKEANNEMCTQQYIRNMVGIQNTAATFFVKPKKKIKWTVCPLTLCFYHIRTLYFSKVFDRHGPIVL